MTDTILLDITSLASAPYRSGIQRVQRELIRHWPSHIGLVLVSMDPSGLMRRLPDSVRDVLLPADHQATTSFEAECALLEQLVIKADWLADDQSRHILNLELFYDTWRADAYLHMCRGDWRVQWLVYDFMPWLHPELFPAGIVTSCMPYLRALRAVPEVAFISRQTCAQYEQRVMRGQGRPGPVLPLGADGIGLEPQLWSPGRRDVVVIGTMERRKNTHLIIAAFRLLWQRGVAVRLVLAGRIDPTFRTAITDFAEESDANKLVILDHADDAAIRQVLRGARMVVNASEIEGFGLPPIEALHSGIPAITSGGLPSLQQLSTAGHIRLPKMGAVEIADAVEALMTDDTAASLWKEAANLHLPTWRDFALAVANWTAMDQAA